VAEEEGHRFTAMRRRQIVTAFSILRYCGVALLVSVCALVACQGNITKVEPLVLDFESDSELDRFHWKCHTLFSLSDDHVSHGQKSLKLELYPSDYPGLEPKLDNNDWRGYKAFRFAVFNPQEKEIRLTIRIDDSLDHLQYEDRYNKTLSLKPGINQIRLSLDRLTTTGRDRKLDLENIYRVLMFVANPQEKIVLYFDYIRLV